MKVELNLGDSQMTGPLALSLYRITQELVTNSLRHGKADNIHVTLNAFDEELNFLYEDDGIGFSKEKIKRGMGLSNVESRIQEQNGTVTIDSSPGKGMVLVADFHLK
jgi:signal transduction histidine kinase